MAKPDSLSSTLGTHREKRTESCELFSDLHICAIACTHACKHTKYTAQDGLQLVCLSPIAGPKRTGNIAVADEEDIRPLRPDYMLKSCLDLRVPKEYTDT